MAGVNPPPESALPPDAGLDAVIEALTTDPAVGYEVVRDGEVVAVIVHPDRYDELCAALRELEH